MINFDLIVRSLFGLRKYVSVKILISVYLDQSMTLQREVTKQLPQIETDVYGPGRKHIYYLYRLHKLRPSEYNLHSVFLFKQQCCRIAQVKFIFLTFVPNSSTSQPYLKPK